MKPTKKLPSRFCKSCNGWGTVKHPVMVAFENSGIEIGNGNCKKFFNDHGYNEIPDIYLECKCRTEVAHA